ncbi:MAG: hypothetical protein QF752_02425 [Planctomycetota bacterium]|nr:hypothetical protein [Planctomycetota bacterium]
MKVLSGTEIFKRIEGSIHAEQQVFERWVELTVATVGRFEGPGVLDFGGSQFRSAPKNTISPEVRDPGEEFGWWFLDPGAYWIELNEKIRMSGISLGQVSPSPRLLSCGAYHPLIAIPTSIEEATISLPLIVSERGLDLKQNARISTLMLMA